jgi:hypothetical protein
MKKIFFVIFLFATSLMAERYMMVFEYNFINGCAEGDNNKINQCICLLSEIQKDTSQAEMLEFSMQAASGQKTSDKLNSKLMTAAMKCTNK